MQKSEQTLITLLCVTKYRKVWVREEFVEGQDSYYSQRGLAVGLEADRMFGLSFTSLILSRHFKVNI